MIRELLNCLAAILLLMIGLILAIGGYVITGIIEIIVGLIFLVVHLIKFKREVDKHE